MNCQDFEKLGVGQNYSLLCDKEVDQAIEDTLSLPIEEQTDAWGELDQKIMTEKFPLFVLGYGGVAMAHGSKINGMYDDPAAGMPTCKSIWFTQ